ncbi:GMC family oxidoreductase [Parvibaculum sedimenti]|uniref:GMC family oxidoreductase n=1 Tax=Parvibaculum sedimenti TaxID=2608632 RepID=A0A6N6VLN2_9HYPH|nr:GMC family oxidoreductase [Parvibaculum sedimenti]KAB7741163.1 GMC family oxidoreductase [Parvibaculum sedimenti]
MFIDGRNVPDGTIVEAEVAIIGAGAAGISIARALRNIDARVVLIESGGLDFEPDTQELYEGESVGVPYALDTSRLRYFGGSTNHWGGWCRPFEPIDFEQRDWVPHSGWPINRADLDPYYVRANEVCQIGPFIYDDPAAVSEGGQYQPLDLGKEVMTRWFEYSPPTRFGWTYRQDIEKASNIKTYLNSNVMEILPNAEATKVERLRVGTLTGRRFEVRPQTVILATGGIENARMLLLSNSIEKAGLGNGRGLVGRYFMEHPHIERPCEIMITDPSLVAPYYQTYTQSAGANIRGVFMFTADYLRKNRRLGTVMTFYKQKEVRTDIDVEEKDTEAARDIEPGIAQLIRSTSSKANESPVLAMRYGTGCATEQAPNPDSRIMLSTEKDALGLNRTKIDWRLSPSDRANLRHNIEALARAFGAWGEGRVRIRLPDRDKWDEAEGWGNHHMGTTRMAADPRKGVVDANCKVHGVENLYVAGSSVFTTSATVNPTLTIVALALRLADHVQTRFTRGV